MRRRNYIQMPTLVKKAIELYRKGVSYKNITKATGLSRRTIYRWAKSEKRRKNNKADLIDVIVEMYIDGLTAQEISDKLGSVSQQIVSLWIRQGDLARKRGPVPILIEDIIENDVRKTRKQLLDRAYYLKHKEERLASDRKYIEENRQLVRERQLKYQHSDKGRMVDKNCKHRRRTQEQNGPGITNQQWNELLREYNFRCAYCGIQTNMTIDHVIPLSKGGKHSIENIVPACAGCNSHKCASLDWKPKIYKKVVGS